MAVLETQGLTKHFGGLTAVQNVNLQVERGTLHSIIGPNGAGGQGRAGKHNDENCLRGYSSDYL